MALAQALALEQELWLLHTLVRSATHASLSPLTLTPPCPCPACSYVTTVVNAADVIPTISPGSADALRQDVMARWAWVLPGGGGSRLW